jgi:hypothetical protein
MTNMDRGDEKKFEVGRESDGCCGSLITSYAAMYHKNIGVPNT